MDEIKTLRALPNTYITPQDGMPLQMMANAIRILAMDAIEKASSGHPGMPMGMADVVTVLWSEFLQHAPWDPHWPNRDRFVLSAGHGSMLLYALLYLTGYAHIDLGQLGSFRQYHSLTPGHPEHGPAIETTTGPLAQGLGNAVGMALAEKILRAQFGPQCTDHYTYVIAGDGCLMEGLSQEAISLAGHWRLHHLIVFWDDNGITIDGPAHLSTSDDMRMRFQASQWDVLSIDGHCFQEIREAILQAHQHTKPTLIMCRTRIGYGAPHKEGKSIAHGAPLGSQEIKEARKALGWLFEEPFFIPSDIKQAWEKSVDKSHYDQWQHYMTHFPMKEAFYMRHQAYCDAFPFEQLWHFYATTQPDQATRKTSGEVFHKLYPFVPFLAGSADLAESTCLVPAKEYAMCMPGQLEPVTTEKLLTVPHETGTSAAQCVHYGVREHAMGAIMNGIALHGGFVACGSTFLTFSDYLRPALRLAALMSLPIIYIFTHDSIGLGEDGPTHQPIEHLASLRAIPNVYVFRPADAIEVVECWQMALSLKAPSLLCLTRQTVPFLHRDNVSSSLLANLDSHAMKACQRGAYVLKKPACLPHCVDIWATGSEVSLACEVRKKLAQANLGARVISFPCWALFEQQPLPYQQSLLGSTVLKVAIEAASPMGWERYVGSDGLIFGINHFGMSAPYKKIYEHFGLSCDHITQKIMDRLNVCAQHNRIPAYEPSSSHQALS